MNVLITGGAGYIGSHVNKLFKENNINTVILDDLSNGHIESVLQTKTYIGDYGDKKILRMIFRQEKIDAVVHMAAFASVPDSVINPSKYYENNVSKMISLLDTMVECDIKYIIFSSSASTFGEPLFIPMDEGHPQAPINPYGFTKLVGEQLLKDYHQAYGLNYCIFRYFCAAGADPSGLIGEAHNPETHVIPCLIKSKIENKVFNIFGDNYPTEDGTCIRDFIHVSDIANAHLLGLYYVLDGNSNDFNLGSNTGYSIKNLTNLIKYDNYIIQGNREGDPSELVASNLKAKNILGWIPKYTITDMLEHAELWERNRRY